jgi:hypothetical protein
MSKVTCLCYVHTVQKVSHMHYFYFSMYLYETLMYLLHFLNFLSLLSEYPTGEEGLPYVEAYGIHIS